MYNNYRVLQMTNEAIGDVAVSDYMPLGRITRRVFGPEKCPDTFIVNNTNVNNVVINEPGNFDILYNASLTAAADGTLALDLVVNGQTMYTVSATVTTGDTVNITLPYQIRVFPNCASHPDNVPSNVEIQLAGVAVTNGTGVLRIERVY